MDSALDKVVSICNSLEGRILNPRFVIGEEYELGKFKKQLSDIDGIDHEWVYQVSDGFDGYCGTMAFKIDGTWLFVVDFEDI